MQGHPHNRHQSLLVSTQTTAQAPVTICSQVLCTAINIEHHHRIFDLHLYAHKAVFFSTVGTGCLNKELNWDSKFFSLLKECLDGKNSNIVVELSQQAQTLRISCDFEGRSIRVLFLQAELTKIKEAPMRHAHLLLRDLHRRDSQALETLKARGLAIEQEIDKSSQLYREVKDMHEFEMEQSKNLFLPVINGAKSKLRPHFNPLMGREAREESEGSEESSTRKVYKIQRVSSSSVKIADFEKLFE